MGWKERRASDAGLGGRSEYLLAWGRTQRSGRGRGRGDAPETVSSKELGSGRPGASEPGAVVNQVSFSFCPSARSAP